MLGIVVLAAGQGTRMRSEVPKVLHPLCGRPMVFYALDAVSGLSDLPPVLVVGHGAEEVRRTVGEAVTYVEQREQLGTGHAVLQARPALEGRADEVLILYADMPLLTGETLRRVVDARRSARAALSILTVVAEDPRGFGRVVRQADGSVARIVEEADATEAERAIRELNAGVYACDAAWLWAHLPALPLSRKGEYYLTDLVEMAAREGQGVVAVATDDPTEALGINTRVHLAEAEALMRRRINRRWMEAGVTMIDPQTTYIEPTVTIGPDTVIWPTTILRGRTAVGRGCHLGPNALIADSVIGDRCRVLASVVEGAVMEEGSDVGPFSHLRRARIWGRGRMWAISARSRTRPWARGPKWATSVTWGTRRWAPEPTLARAPSPAILTDARSTARSSGRRRSSAPAPCWSRRSGWAAGPSSGPAPW